MKRRKRYTEYNKEHNFWPSFTDMMVTIALILFFLIILAFVQNIIFDSHLKEANEEISKKKDKIKLLRDEVDEIRAEVERGEKILKLYQRKTEKQKEIIAESNRELGNLRAQLRDIAMLRLDVLEKVKKSIEVELGQENQRGEELLKISENGNIMLNEGLMFDLGSYEIKPEGKELLDQLSVAFENILENRDVRKYIDAINIQGHTDSNSSHEFNRDLSTKRATSVVNYLLNANQTLEKLYGRYFLASGYSEFRPAVIERTEEDRARNRRIEISIILKDSNVRDMIEDYLEGSMEIFEQGNKNLNQ
ncbi:OmpA family protein [Dethiothermospora halolimnae]|uniref:OmpA/MotB family protein n=1 Tax=Dethiothermospora halolimnae TaxID=3114390 RepID=UPI003CCC21C5